MNPLDSRLFILVLKYYLHHRRNQMLFEQINAAAENQPDLVEQVRLEGMRHLQTQALQGEW